MSSFHIFKVSASAMQAQTTRLNTVASNLANSESVAGSADEAYRARMPLFSTVLEGEMKGAVSVTGVAQSAGEIPSRYEPGHPLADENGYVFGSNVNPMEEMANMISASRAYQNSVEVMNTAKDLMTATINMGK